MKVFINVYKHTQPITNRGVLPFYKPTMQTVLNQ